MTGKIVPLATELDKAKLVADIQRYFPGFKHLAEHPDFQDAIAPAIREIKDGAALRNLSLNDALSKLDGKKDILHLVCRKFDSKKAIKMLPNSSKLNLTGSKMTNTVWHDGWLSGSDLRFTQWDGSCYLQRCDLSRVEADKSLWKGVNFLSCNFASTYFCNASFTDCVFEDHLHVRQSFKGTDVEDASFIGCTFHDVDFTGIEGVKSNTFKKCEFKNCTISHNMHMRIKQNNTIIDERTQNVDDDPLESHIQNSSGLVILTPQLPEDAKPKTQAKGPKKEIGTLIPFPHSLPTHEK